MPADDQPMPPLPLYTDIIAACEKLRSINGNTYGTLVYSSIESPSFFIKYGPKDFGMAEEMRSQKFAFEALEKLPPKERIDVHVLRYIVLLKTAQ